MEHRRRRRGAGRAGAGNRPLTIFSFHLLNQAPLVAAVYSGEQLRLAADRMVRLARGAEAHLLVRPTWHGPESFGDIAGVIASVAPAAPRLRFAVLTATADDADLADRAGLDAIWCNHNAFVDEQIYTPDLDAERLYDAVYVARLVPLKRLELAARVPRLAVITGGYEVERDYARTLIAALEGLRFVNFGGDTGVMNFEPDQVRAVLNQSRCGLALSAVEGAMYASVEYLLCGLPVVTTPSKGGRDVFFHPDYVETVDPDPAAVADGVARMIARRLNPLPIRRRTLELIRPHRARLIERLSQLTGRDLFASASDSLWLPSFTHKLETWVRP